MNDRFKFRVWDKEQNKYLPLVQRGDDIDFWISLDNTGVYLVERDNNRDVAYFNDITEDVIVQFCTGLKDKNGKLIYEGDIVNQIYEDETIYKCEVVYNNCSFQLKHIEDKNKNYINTPMYCYAINYLGHYTEKRLEVIGNIYENKELLECQK